MTTRRSTVDTPTGGVMTEEVGAITGLVVITTSPSDHGGLDVTIAYKGARDTYSVVGSPTHAGIRHNQVIDHLTSDQGTTNSGNPAPADLTGIRPDQAPHS